ASSAHANPVEIAYSRPQLIGILHAPLSATSPAASLREGLALVRTQPPAGLGELDWYLGDSTIVAPTLTGDEASRLERLASWFERNPVVTSYTLTVQAGVQTWTLVTSQEVPDVVRDFGATAGAGTTVKVSASAVGKPPYLTLP
ncbi:MAG TPA: hypothetical protein VLS51_08100, partial [Propionibacteriaceae bacterium]|nr:hypothetical protein [Propionibacteriaceae bacterium]